MTVQSKVRKPLIGSKVTDWVPIVLSATFLLYWWQPWDYLTPAISLILFINFSVVAALLWWADGYEREPGTTILWAILWGVFTAIAITSLITPGEASLFVAAIVEEASKLLGLFWIYKRGSIHSATDALVMGGFIGLGFTIFEDFTYSAGTSEAVEILIYRGIFSVFAHTLFSGIGAAIMFLLWKRLGGGGVVLGFIASYLIHYLWNISLSIDLASISPLVYLIVYAVWPPVALVVTCILVRQRETSHIRSSGAIAVANGVISQDTLNHILKRSDRKKALKQIGSFSERREFRSGLHVSARQILEFDESSQLEITYDELGPSSTSEEDPWA
jgi:RsiW-degrading membrane proteinase PrsW (M82 family)